VPRAASESPRSHAGTEALAAALTSPPATYADATDPSGQRRLAYADGVLVNQVVPSYTSEASGVARYRDAIERLDSGALGASSFEGYFSAELLPAVLRRNGPDTRDFKAIGAGSGIDKRS
jgi:hypothetical protein